MTVHVSWNEGMNCDEDSLVCAFQCDCEPGNPNADPPDGVINIFDVTYLISNLYLGGADPIPYAICSGDANCDCTVNIFDVTFLISKLYLGGGDPCTCDEWLDGGAPPPLVGNCGPPLR